MEVIEGPKTWSVVKDCVECKAKLRIGIDDVFVLELDGDYTCSGTPWMCAACCVCGTLIKIANHWHAPPLVYAAAKRKGKGC